MRQCLLLAILLLVISYCANAQYNRYFIQFSDKKGTTASLSNPSTYLSARAIARRTKQHIDIDSTDLPVSKAYLDSLRSVPNLTLISASKWLNQACIQTTDPNALNKINSFSFVKKTTAVAPRVGGVQEVCEPGAVTGTTDLQYGSMYNQIHIHEGEYLHNQGYTGKGMVIAILDAGFNSYLTNPVFDSVRLQGRVLGTWDFVTNDANVNEDAQHGANCFSILASNRPGVLLGSAPHASYWLLRTENVSGEYPIEEQNWAMGAEFADSAGVDMISSSLGYEIFDIASASHTYAQRNGNTALITIAADLAAKKGILVVNSAGNSGNANTDSKYISCPADGDSVLAVGAVDVNGNIAGLSSWGPNGAGLLKPNVVSVGAGTVLANTNGTPGSGSGTSYACPNMAGLIACLWQAFPDFTNMEIFDAVQQAGSRHDNPDGRFGYGIPNFHVAYEQLLALREVRGKDSLLNKNFLRAYPVPTGGNGFRLLLKAPATGKATLRLVNSLGQVLDTRVVNVQANQTYFVNYTNAPVFATGVYYIQYNDGANKGTLPIIR